jgi:hypothetical protein
MSWKNNINNIKEIFPGHFQIILDFATVKVLPFVLSDRYKYVWVITHEVTGSLEWKEYELPLFDNHIYYNVLARKIRYDYIMPTTEFRSILTKVGPGITLIQLNQLPNYYLNPAKIHGKTRYDLLIKECDYLFEIDLPIATDYGTLISSDRDYLQSLLDDTTINWNDLP